MKGYVYKYTSPNGKSYIGITKNLRRRKAEHKRLSKDVDRAFYRAIRKYGYENFSFEILEIVEAENLSRLKETLFDLEKKYIQKFDSFKNGYNSTLGGDGTYGLAGELNPFYNKKHSDESKAKMRKAKKGIKLSQEHKEKIRVSTIKALKNLTSEKKERMIHAETRDRKKVYCFDNDTVYDSVRDCSQKLGIQRSDIRNVCSGKRITAKGKRFKFLDSDVVLKTENKRYKAIKCLQNDKIYLSITQACEELNVRHQHVSAILHGRQKTTKGYSFIFAWQYRAKLTRKLVWRCND